MFKNNISDDFTEDDYLAIANSLTLKKDSTKDNWYQVNCKIHPLPTNLQNALLKFNKKFDCNIVIGTTSLSLEKLNDARSWYFKKQFGNGAIATKSTKLWFIDSFLQDTIQIAGDNNWVSFLREWEKKPWTVTGDGVVSRRRKEPQYDEKTKEGFSKSQSVCLNTANALFPTYGSCGFIFPPSTFLPSKRLYTHDSVTTNRPYDYLDRQQAINEFEKRKKIKHHLQNLAAFENQRNEYLIFGSIEELNQYFKKAIQYGERKEHTDCLVRLKITEDTCIGIFTNDLPNRAEAIYLAELCYQRKLAQAASTGESEKQVTYPRILYYCRDSFRVLTPYTQELRTKDINKITQILENKSDEEIAACLPLFLAVDNIELLRERILKPIKKDNIELPLIWWLILKEDKHDSKMMCVIDQLAKKMNLFNDIDALIAPLLSLDGKTLEKLNLTLWQFISRQNASVGFTRCLLELHKKNAFINSDYKAKNGLPVIKKLLSHAIHSTNEEIAGLILEYKDFIFDRYQSNVDYTPLSQSLSFMMPKTFEKLLKDPHIDLKLEGPYCLLYAIKMGNLNNVIALLDAGIDPNSPLPKFSKIAISDTHDYKKLVGTSYTALMWAAIHDHTEIAKYLLKHNADITAVTPDKHNAISLAAKNRSYDTLKTLLMHEEAKNLLSYGNPPKSIVEIVWQGKCPDDIVELLIDAGAKDTVGYLDNKDKIAEIKQFIINDRKSQDSEQMDRADRIEKALEEALHGSKSVIAVYKNNGSSLYKAIHYSIADYDNEYKTSLQETLNYYIETLKKERLHNSKMAEYNKMKLSEYEEKNCSQTIRLENAIAICKEVLSSFDKSNSGIFATLNNPQSKLYTSFIKLHNYQAESEEDFRYPDDGGSAQSDEKKSAEKAYEPYYPKHKNSPIFFNDNENQNDSLMQNSASSKKNLL